MKTGTLKELDVQPGDVVKNIDDLLWCAPGTVHTCVEGKNGYGFDDIGPFNDAFQAVCSKKNSYVKFELISRASDEPRTWGEMTDAEKGALLLADRDGKEIETFDPSLECDVWSVCHRPSFDSESLCYRIKLEATVETVTLDGFTHNNEWFFREKDARKTHRITFTVTDGEPDCSSIKMERIDA